MKALWEIASGKRFRTNAITGAASEEALQRYTHLNLAKNDRALQLALISVAPDMVAKIVENLPRGWSPDKSKLVALATFFAWLLPEHVSNADSGFLQRNGTTLNDMHRLREMVYPVNDTVSTAITRFKANREAFSANDDAVLLRYTHERWDTINQLVGLPGVGTLFEDEYQRMKYGLGIDRAVDYGVGYFAEWYQHLKSNPESMK